MCYQTQTLLIFVMYFSDIGQCFHLATKKSAENKKKPATLGLTRIIYLTFSKYCRPLDSWGRRRRQIIPELLTDRNFLEFFETYLYMEHLGLRPFLGSRGKLSI